MHCYNKDNCPCHDAIGLSLEEAKYQGRNMSGGGRGKANKKDKAAARYAARWIYDAAAARAVLQREGGIRNNHATRLDGSLALCGPPNLRERGQF